ncbi:GNAT family N-acetyltransferase [Halovenus sp. HT40]|uniref:GNAT family N-acetyltransferase n=1 Tax=Halovenus sp. HT40 TaxID=3126691 RepID=UPI00300EE830
MGGPVFVRGEKVRLRPIERDDLSFLSEHRNDPRVWRSLGWPKPENHSQEETFFEETVCDDQSTDLLVTVDDSPVGMVSFNSEATDHDRAELGYWIAPTEQGTGYATDAVRTLVEYGFQQRGFHRIEAEVFERNDASRAVLDRLGFTHEATIREKQWIDGEYRDVEWFGLLRSEWE